MSERHAKRLFAINPEPHGIKASLWAEWSGLFFLDSPWPLSQHSGLHKQTESGAEITSCAPPLFCENLVLFLSADRTCFSFASCDEKHHGILWLSSLSYYTKPHMTITIFAKCFPDAMRRRCNRQRFRHSSVFFFPTIFSPFSSDQRSQWVHQQCFPTAKRLICSNSHCGVLARTAKVGSLCSDLQTHTHIFHLRLTKHYRILTNGRKEWQAA